MTLKQKLLTSGGIQIALATNMKLVPTNGKVLLRKEILIDIINILKY